MPDPDETKPPPREEPYVETERDRHLGNIILLVILAVLVGGGVWLVNAMFEQRQLDDCIAQGRRNCAPIEMPRR